MLRDPIEVGPRAPRMIHGALGLGVWDSRLTSLAAEVSAGCVLRVRESLYWCCGLAGWQTYGGI